MVGWHRQFNGYELGKLQEMVREQEGLVYHSPWGHNELDTTWQLNTNTHSHGAVGITKVN